MLAAIRARASAPRVAEAPPHRAQCYRCFKAAATCICASIERAANRTGIVILQHPRERLHAIGTVRFARLGLRHVRVRTCVPGTDASMPLPPRTAVLYPAPGAPDLAALPRSEHPRHLVILDGTWTHARKMYATQTWLHELPQVCLTPAEPSRYRLRREPRPDYVATLEAIVAALRILEPGIDGLDALLGSFAAMIDRQAEFSPARER
ncbi:MAG: DTW domain-containing protein [Deltaproteobacteria bacterium]|nr:DTW domain-containing protein [Deltaproteobacteria bacterium]